MAMFFALVCTEISLNDDSVSSDNVNISFECKGHRKNKIV